MLCLRSGHSPRTSGAHLTLVFAAALWSAPAAAAPPFELADLDGAVHDAEQYLGSPLVLEWLNPNCPFSRRHAAEGTMQSLAAAHPEVIWLGVNSTSPGHGDHLEPAAHLATNAELGIYYPVLLDPTGEAAAAYGVDVTPHLV
ncbi:MAG: redoxin domain-containing protein, partial [Acidobacteria bacterium]|nr:redoxin domain-containing protein [Acidobacteriota bacterium]